MSCSHHCKPFLSTLAFFSFPNYYPYPTLFNYIIVLPQLPQPIVPLPVPAPVLAPVPAPASFFFLLFLSLLLIIIVSHPYLIRLSICLKDHCPLLANPLILIGRFITLVR